MPITHLVYEATFTGRVIEIPDVCPGCQADLTQTGALLEGNYVDCTVASHVAGDTLKPDPHTEFGETYYPVGLICAECDWVAPHSAPATAVDAAASPS